MSLSDSEDLDSKVDSLAHVSCPGLFPQSPAPGVIFSQTLNEHPLQDNSRRRPHSGIVLNVEHSNEVANPSTVEECLQIRELGEVTPLEQATPTILSQIHENFTWDNFYYAFFFGLLPTAWDISTDIQFGMSQEAEREETTAGFCYMFICLPPIFGLLIPAFSRRLQKDWSHLLTCLISIVITSVMAFAIVKQPIIFKYPALICSFFTLAIKILAVFLHTPEMIEFSLNASSAESSYESSAQLLFLLHIWLSGGNMYLTAMVSSILVIGKVGAENILMKGQENKMKDKSFLEKVGLLARFTPVLALTALFRVGCASTVLYHPHLFLPLTPAFAMFLTWIYLMCSLTLLLTLLSILRTWISNLRQLNIVELGLGLLNECTTLAVWGSLGREGSKGLQLGVATYHLLINCSYLSWQMAAATAIEQATGVNPYTRPFISVSNVVLACGPISYLLAVYQLLLVDI